MAIDMTPEFINQLVQSDPSLKRLVSDRAINMARQQVLNQLNLGGSNAMPIPQAQPVSNDQLVNWAIPAVQQAVAQQAPVAAQPLAAAAVAAPAQAQNPLALVDSIYKEVMSNFEVINKKLDTLAQGVEGDLNNIKETLHRIPVTPPSYAATVATTTPAPAQTQQAHPQTPATGSSKNKKEE